MAPNASNRREWRRVLYEHQVDFPDNFAGEDFMAGLQNNVTAQTYSLWSCVRGACRLLQQLGIVCAFVLVFVLLRDNRAADWLPLALVIASSLLLTVVCHLENGDDQFWASFLKWAAKRNVMLLAYGFGLTPLMHTLTGTVSTDTVYAMCTAAFLLHLAVHDYGVDAPIVSPAISLNAAVFASVCLMSRLADDFQAFGLLNLTYCLFALWPAVKKHFRLPPVDQTRPLFVNVPPEHAHKFRAEMEQNVPAQLTVVAYLALVGVVAYLESFVAAGLMLCALFFLLLVCPLLLVCMQEWKNTIHGPWDEAMLNDAALGLQQQQQRPDAAANM